MSAANEKLRHEGVSEGDRCCVEIVPQDESSQGNTTPAAAAAASSARGRGVARGRKRMRDGKRQGGHRAAAAPAGVPEQKPYVLMNVLVPKQGEDSEKGDDKEDEEDSTAMEVSESDDGDQQKAGSTLQAMQQEIAKGVGADKNPDGLTEEQREALLLQLFAFQNNFELAQQQEQDSSDSDSDSDSDVDSDDSDGAAGHAAMEL